MVAENPMPKNAQNDAQTEGTAKTRNGRGRDETNLRRRASEQSDGNQWCRM